MDRSDGEYLRAREPLLGHPDSATMILIPLSVIHGTVPRTIFCEASSTAYSAVGPSENPAVVIANSGAASDPYYRDSFVLRGQSRVSDKW